MITVTIMTDSPEELTGLLDALRRMVREECRNTILEREREHYDALQEAFRRRAEEGRARQEAPRQSEQKS